VREINKDLFEKMSLEDKTIYMIGFAAAFGPVDFYTKENKLADLEFDPYIGEFIITVYEPNTKPYEDALKEEERYSGSDQGFLEYSLREMFDRLDFE